MSENIEQSLLIPDSEAEEDEVILWRPSNREETDTKIELETSSSPEHIIEDHLYPSLLFTGAVTTDSGLLATDRYKRMLRKRKAIQKMPYSLDRIKHRQLLQGYDVTNFDLVSNDVTLPTKPATHPAEEKNSEARVMSTTNNDDLEWRDGMIENDSYENEKVTEDEDDNLILNCQKSRHRIIHTDEDNDEEGSDDKEPLDSQMMFRGRMVNIKTGYRGILPRIAWEKSLKSSTNGSAKRKRDFREERKGIAKRKKIPHQHLQDDELLNELIVPDDQVEEEVSFSDGPYDQQGTASDNDLGVVGDYFEEKYSKSYHFDNLSDEEILSQPTDDFMSDFNANETIQKFQRYDTGPGKYPTDLDGNSDGELSNYNDLHIIAENNFSDRSLSDDGAEECNQFSIDAMLYKANRVSRNENKGPKNMRNSSGPTKEVDTGRKEHGKRRKSAGRSTTSRTRKPLQNNTAPTYRMMGDNKLCFQDLDQSEAANIITVSESAGAVLAGNEENFDNRQGSKKGKKRRKNKKILQYFQTIPNDTTSELVRKVNTFTTVVEGTSNQFALTKRKSKLTPALENGKADLNNSGNNELSSSEVFKSTLFGSTFNPPDIVPILLSNNQYILSRLSSDIKEKLREIFNHVVNIGATDSELLKLSRSITEFLFLLNQPAVYEIIDEFHRNFRSKVNTLRERAKPIHFYQIAICQVMFLEVSRYTNVAVSTSIEMEKKIVDHIASFFKLLSRCYATVIEGNIDLLVESYNIVSLIVQSLGGTKTVWELLSTNTFPPKIALVLTNLFPTTEEHWNITKPDQTYQSALQWTKFVRDCTRLCHWEITSEVLLKFYDFFKKRKFQDFEEEERQNKGIYPIISLEFEIPNTTVFNGFLRTLNSSKLSPATLERITPLGNIANLRSLSLLANRINLIITLAIHAPNNYEKRFNELVAPYFVEDSTISIPKLAFKCILEGITSILEVNASKNLLSKGKSITLVWKALKKMNDASLNDIWDNFITNLSSIFRNLDRSKPVLLRTLYPILHSMLKEKHKMSNLFSMLEIYTQNLQILGTNWVQSHLFQVLAAPANKSVKVLDFYCTVLKYLADENAVTWWSIFNYNNFDGNETIKLFYYYKLVQFCDPSTFLQIKNTMFTTAIDNLLKRSDSLYQKFLIELSNKDYRFNINFTDGTFVTQLQIIKRTISALHKASYHDLIRKFIANTKTSFLLEPNRRDFYVNVVKFLNSNFVDQIKGSHDFLYLKNEFGISNAETEKSAFRELLASHKDQLEKAAFVENEILQTYIHGLKPADLLEKLESSFGTNVYENDFKLFTELVRANTLANSIHKSDIQWIALNDFINLINTTLSKRYYQTTPNEFFELCKLHKFLCQNYRAKQCLETPRAIMLQYYIKICDFQINMLHMSSGFFENGLLKRFTKDFLSNTSAVTEPLDSGPLITTVKNLLDDANSKIHLDSHTYGETELLLPDLRAKESYLSNIASNSECPEH